jgi:hypothetical protein
LFKKYKKNENFKNNATFIIIDFNGEYIDDAIVSEERKNSYDLTTKEIKQSLNQNLHKSFLCDLLCNMYSAAHDNAGHFLGH